LFTRQLGVYTVKFRITFKASTAPTGLYLISGQNVINRDIGVFLDQIKVALPNPVWTELSGTGSYATIEDHYTFECQSPQRFFEIRVTKPPGYEFMTGQVELSSVSSATDDITQPVTLMMCVDPSDNMKF